MKDREQILNMLAKVDDQFSLSIYKRVYNIDDGELADRRKKIKHQQSNDSIDK
jgi:hypothetical protein